MSRISHHLKVKDYKKTRQRCLDEQRALYLERREKEIQEEKEKKKIEEAAKPFKSNWRNDINEGMTSSGVFFATLNPPENTYDNPIVAIPTSSISYVNATNSDTRLITLGKFDLSSVDRFEINATRLGSSGVSYGWVLQANGTVIAAGGENDPIRVADASDLAIFKSGKVTLSIRQSTSSFYGDPANSSAVSGWTINNIKFYRTVPTNVFVSLDSPEATNFIRTDPTMRGLSAEERRNKLIEMLEAGNEYLLKALGMTGNKVEFADTGNIQSWEQSADNEIAQLSPSDYNQERQIDQMLLKGLQRGDYGTGPAIDKQIQDILKNMQQGTPGGLPQAQADQDTQIAATYPQDPKWMRDLQKEYDKVKDKPFKPGTPKPGRGPDTWEGPVRNAHYEPEGQLISEKKLRSPKEVMNKIPGYYDGKPAPLGFPDNPPPEMINGFHPDLVDGKNVANRFNRLDPQSAQAMPLTGNPHIDKKVLRARKQPK